jgi:hypothetical protein
MRRGYKLFNLRGVPNAPNGFSPRRFFGLFAVRNELQIGW